MYKLATTRRRALVALAVLSMTMALSAAQGQEGQHTKAEGGTAPEVIGAKTEKKSKTPPAMEHTLDSRDGSVHLFDSIEPLQHIHLPAIFGFQITKFMVLELIAAGLIVAIYIPIAKRLKNGQPPRGAWDNAFEGLLTFVRDQIAKPSLGDDTADRYVPFLWTLFLYILFNNLLGLVPFMGSPTASIYVTAALALIVFFALHGSAILEMGKAGHGHDSDHHGHDEAHGHGPEAHGQLHTHGEAATASGGVLALAARGFVNYVKSLWPQIDLPGPLGWVIKPVVFVIEVMGVLVRNAVLAVRLFANMFAGHMVLATLLFFIQMASNVSFFLWGTITLSSVLGIVALSLLELFIAFLQAYVFTFLTALFMGMGMHPQH
jgi:F-type H+-transporting ATPase subunit a